VTDNPRVCNIQVVTDLAFALLPFSGYGRYMSVDSIKEAIAALPIQERRALASWLNEFEYDAWDKQMVRDFSPGGQGAALVERVKREIADGKTTPLQEGRTAVENQRERSRH
jgi:hypothetical protein